MDDDVQVKFGAETSGYNAGVDAVTRRMGEIGESAQGLIGSLESLAGTFATVFAIDKIEDFARSMANVGEQVERIQSQTGLSSDQVQNFQNSIKLMGGDADTAAMSLIRLERNIADAAAGVGNSQSAFLRLGVSMDTLKRGDVNEVLAQMADRMSKTSDGANKLAAMLEVAGRGGASLIPALDQGRDGLKHMQEAIDATGVKLSPDLVDKFANSAKGIEFMDFATKGLRETMYAQLEPALDSVVFSLRGFSESATEGIKNGSALGETLKLLGGVLVGIVVNVDLIITAIKQFGDVALGVFHSVVDGATGVAAALKDLATFNFTKAVLDYGAAQQKAFDDIKKGWTDAGAEGAKYWSDMTAMLKIYNGEVSVNPTAGVKKEKSGLPQIGAPEQKDDSDKSDQIAEKQREIYSEDYNVKKEMDALKVASGEMTQQQMYSDLQAELLKEHNLIDTSFDEQAKLYEADSQKYQQIQQEKYIADQKFAIEKMKLDQEAAQNSNKEWTSAINTINHSFDTMLTGVLQGTQTISQAFARMAGNMIVSVISAIGRIIIENGLLVLAQQLGFVKIATALAANLGEWNLTETQKTAATTTGNSVRAAADAAAATESLAVVKATTSAEIASYAGVAGAASFQSVAAIPVVGWAMAPGVSEAAIAQVLSYEAFDVGTPNVPHDMLAQIHEGEAIIPKKQAQAWRDGDTEALGGGGGSPNVHFHMTGMDGADIMKTMMKNSGVISKALRSSARGGNGAIRAALRGR